MLHRSPQRGRPRLTRIKTVTKMLAVSRPAGMAVRAA
jgi:hypothetical protein